MIFDLLQDLTAFLAALPADHPRRRILQLLDEAIRRDVHFIARHPTTLFQCLWNSGWWHDCPEAAKHYVEPKEGWQVQQPPWARPGLKLSSQLEAWHAKKELHTPGFRWLRSLHPLPTPLGGRLRNTLRGHATWVYDVAFSPDGEQLVSVSRDSTVRIWDVQSGAQQACLTGHSKDVYRASFSSDGRSLISIGEAEEIVWDLTGGGRMVETKEHPEHYEFAHRQCLSPDGRLLVRSSFVDDKALVEIVDTVSGEPGAGLGPDASLANCFAFSADGRLLASGSGSNDVLGLPPDDCSVRIWDVSTGAELRCLGGHLARVQRLQFSPDGRYLVSASKDHTARVWDVSRGALVACLRHPAEVGCLAISPDSRWLATGAGDDNALRIWELGDLGDSASADLELLEVHRGSVAAISSDGRSMATYHGQGTFCVRDSRSGALLGRFCGDPTALGGYFGACALSPDGQLLVIPGPDLSIEVWEVPSGRQRVVFRGRAETGFRNVDRHTHGPLSFTFLNGRTLLSVGMMEGVIRTWDVESGRALAAVSEHGNAPKVGRDVAVSPDGQLIASCNDHTLERVRLWEADTGRVLRHIGSGMEGPSVAFSEDGRRIATFGGEGCICLFDVASGAECARVPLPKAIVLGCRIATSSDGSRVACDLFSSPLTGDMNRTDTTTAWVWDVETGNVITSTAGIAPLEIFAQGGSTLMAVRRGPETAIVSAMEGETVAAFLGSGLVVPLEDRVWTFGHDLGLDYNYRIRMEGSALANDPPCAQPLSPAQG